jgi:Uma2 family endonuclease
MTTAIAPPPPAPTARPAAAVGPTAADLLALIDRLGGVPANRVRMWPIPGTATKDDAIHSKSWYGALCELVDGTLVEKPVGLYESGVAQAVGLAIGMYNLPRKLGFIGGEQGMYSVIPDQLRMPDVSFTSWDRMPSDYPANPSPDVSPDLAVEVLSPSNTAREIERKRREYFAGGTRLVWVFDPPTRTVTVFKPRGAEPAVLHETDMLDGSDVLPGFTMPVSMAFDVPLRPGADSPPGRQPPPTP